ncbi:DUF1778 domain-containing protein [Mesorhizobium sp. YC-39]|uniref:type II toxin -antitoxin system TacA 1-like antitoxin n=1 Tax=unclassified Mesorhizobium TaxID=325217 RepID=UPI0021E8A2BC|nr:MULTISPECIES: DUF1778 domain-containing protein [unclassified Mesorhizobium]MCV3206196.1 DUF1778 domain-containing protein [Mesorhizobium sp. YC-2]MCV3227404.1 DUF1778 domain-containing protein [Mesorhizobium sp. YC-39]
MPRSTDSETEPDAEIAIDAVELVKASAPDFARILDLLDHPPNPNARLRAAIAALPDIL